jgi:MurNAc alpha-1-phosphate uridylyltransferase
MHPVYPQTAMILAAGRGKRMHPLTEHTPKPLLPVAGKPLIVWQIERLAAAGIHQIVINHAWLGNQLVQTLGNGSRWGVQIQYSAEPPEAGLETGGGIRQALPLLGDQPFLVLNADVWCDLPLNQLNLPAGDLAHLVLVPNPAHHPHGDFHLDLNGRVTSQANARYTYSGIGVYHPELFHNLPNGTYPLAPILHQIITINKLSGRCYTGDWFDVGTPQRLAALRQHPAVN